MLTIDEAPDGIVVFRIQDNSLDHVDLGTLRVWLNGNDITQPFMTLLGQFGTVDAGNTLLRIDLPIAHRIGPYTVLRAEVQRKPEHGGQFVETVQDWTDPVHALVRKRIRDSFRFSTYDVGTLGGAVNHMYTYVWPEVHQVENAAGNATCFPWLYTVSIAADGSASLTPGSLGYQRDVYSSNCVQELVRPEVLEAGLDYAERIGIPGTRLVFVGHYHLATSEPQWGAFPVATLP